VKDLRDVIEGARRRFVDVACRTCLFIAVIHRFSKLQQDVLLPDVETGVIALIGATTQNPFFALTPALVSRSRIFELQALQPEDIKRIIHHALADKEHGFGLQEINLYPKALDFLVETADGDARRALGGLEVGVLSSTDRPLVFTEELARESVQRKAVVYDSGDTHYDCASALIKSIRGSDVDAGMYWLARMLEGGEDVRFLARRLVILASEDIGNADPRALAIALNAWDVQERLGSPEGELTLAQAVIYMACAAKSNASYKAFNAAMATVQDSESHEVPMHIRNAPTSLMKDMEYGADYRYAHDAPEGYSAGENYFPEALKNKHF